MGSSPGGNLPLPAGRGGYRSWLLLPLLILAVFTYSISFRDRPIIDQQKSVLADADAGPYKVLIEEFSLSRQLGDPLNTINRGNREKAQKHKMHHVLYGMVGHSVYVVIRGFERLVGGTGSRAAYSVNAIIAGLNIVLLFLLLSRAGGAGAAHWLYLLLYAASLSTWLFASVPESWPFSGTLVLLFFLLLVGKTTNPLLLAGILGVFMLNNMTLIGLLAPLWLRELGRRPASSMARLVLGTGAITAGVWLGSLFLLGLFDPTLRPDRLIRYTLWFKQYVASDLPIWSPYVWKTVLAGLFVNSFASNQADPALPPEALRSTFEQSLLGSVTVIVVVSLLGLALVRAVRDLVRKAGSGGWRAVAGDASAWLLLYCLVQALVTAELYYGAGLLYSPTVVPLVVLLAARHVKPTGRVGLAAAVTAVILFVVNNTNQVVKFRRALTGTQQGATGSFREQWLALVTAGLASSKADARRGLEAKGFSLNGERLDGERVVGTNDLLAGRYLVLQKGKKNYAMLEVGKTGGREDGK